MVVLLFLPVTQNKTKSKKGDTVGLKAPAVMC